MLRAVMIAAFTVVLATSCGDDDDPTRLIPPGDTDYVTLELPESTGECSIDTDCEQSCEHSCWPVPPPGPITCPTVPPPKPKRVSEAECLCTDAVCAWWE